MEVGQMDERAPEGVDRLCPAVESVGQFHHLPVGNELAGIASAPVLSCHGISDQLLAVVPIRLGEQEDRSDQGVEPCLRIETICPRMALTPAMALRFSADCTLT